MVEPLDELRASVNAWRSAKRHPTEKVPEDLWCRALRAIPAYGMSAVAEATKFDRQRLSAKRARTSSAQLVNATPTVVPAFSRLELSQQPSNFPIAEVETPTGVKLRVFASSRETIGLLSLICGVGGGS